MVNHTFSSLDMSLMDMHSLQTVKLDFICSFGLFFSLLGIMLLISCVLVMDRMLFPPYISEISEGKCERKLR